VNEPYILLYSHWILLIKIAGTDLKGKFCQNFTIFAVINHDENLFYFKIYDIFRAI